LTTAELEANNRLERDENMPVISRVFGRELMGNWELARQKKALHPIEPLE